MNGAINFTQTFSHGAVIWHWPIAVYLLLAGMSGGALIVAIMIKYYKKQTGITPLFKAASSLALVTILLGMVCLVGDLDRPLLFWKILINYNFKSVMSIGVAALCIYIPLCFVMCIYAFEEELKKTPLKRLVEILMAILNPLRKPLYTLALIFAIAVCAYTGFLISVLVRFPILNTAVLPALFVASGLSAGIAGSSLIATACFKEETHSSDMKILHTIEWPVLVAEILLITMLFVSLIIGSEVQKIASTAFLDGFYAKMFWIGVVGIGFVAPIVINFCLGKKFASTHFAFYLSAIASIIGVLMLRMFILYAGQTYSILI
ncbi:polysulfide reductase NrfD [Campylobacter sp. faydin G-24]|uniref:Polysulfide reductase NrfD n=1 Tax=Campylobacter anatolicus TaxID=2829105 RepID=A0ABS5HJP9_9BACT|nr:NrfD/PsrC family molybdoenzyme membrane anchor subunit [Campylobacter anatolicus]MBR8461327.1 polysulfide reductase NrfD [Campylobacter anatolicus]MBR8464490.1 polysulfide reductase NrfD [Campylobacter anatolicus]MBR8466297.1 polysulfide reductase NrfD [Campylobacter anatolicus]